MGLWADFEVIDAIPRRRRWNLKVRARDRTVRRDGSVEPRDGRTLASDLWTAWADAATVLFTDLDFAATGQTHPVRIAAISEEIPVPADAGSWGESVVSLVVIEV